MTTLLRPRVTVYPIDEFLREIFMDGDHVAFRTACLQYFCTDLDRDLTLLNIRNLAEKKFDEFIQPHDLHTILRGLNNVVMNYVLVTPEKYGELLVTLLALFYNTTSPALHNKIDKAAPQADYNAFLVGHETYGSVEAEIVEKMDFLCRRENTETANNILDLLDRERERPLEALMPLLARERQTLFRQRDKNFVNAGYVSKDNTVDGLIYYLWDITSRFWSELASRGVVGSLIDNWEDMLKFEEIDFNYDFPDLSLFVPPSSELSGEPLLKAHIELTNDVFEPTKDGNVEWNHLGQDSKQAIMMYLSLASLVPAVRPSKFLNALYQNKSKEPWNFAQIFMHQMTKPYSLPLSMIIDRACHLGDGGKTIPAKCWQKIEEAREDTEGSGAFSKEVRIVQQDPKLFKVFKQAEEKEFQEDFPEPIYETRESEKKQEETSVLPLVVGACALGVVVYVLSE